VPAVGEEVNDEVPVNQVWEIYSIKINLIADSNVADRTVTLVINAQGGGIIRRAPATTQQADEEQNYNYICGGTTAVITANTEQEISLPTPIILPPGANIATVTTNIQVGDQFDATSYSIRKWIQ